MAVRHQYRVDLGQRVEGDAGIVMALRAGPAHGEARIDHTGSTRMFSPEAWISQLA